VRFVERVWGYIRSREGLIKLDWEMSKCKLAFPQGLNRLRKNSGFQVKLREDVLPGLKPELILLA
jgi:hypothetical protein